ncbi:family 78 glycoside hydrolase catalytic domain [Microbacterium sp. CJ88]|uniref:family 78 glycoside hydrolase catalytic domain n=1 Tax=Microbacterium sp. CJ88 TaxID=3445672 RepID=UPI003F65EF20
MRRSIRAVLAHLAIAAIVSTSLVVLPAAGASAAREGSGATLSVGTLETNAAVDPLGIPLAAPALSWNLTASTRGTVQSAYQVRVASSAARLSSPDVWDSGRVVSPNSTEVVYGGPALTGATSYAWQVRVWDASGRDSGWSTPARFETALASAADWAGAEWVGADRSIPAAWTDYTMTFRASGISGALGVFLRGRDGSNTHMWQISESEKALRPHVKTDGAYTVLASTPFPAGFDFAAEHEYAVRAEGTTIQTTVDGTVLDTRTVTQNTAPGLIGFRTNGAEKGAVLQAKVVAKDGTVLLDTSFDDGDRTFTSGTVSGGALQMSGNTEIFVSLGNDVPVVRTEFTASKKVASARIYAAARGVYALTLNGKPVGDAQLAPGWTDYNTRIDYQTYDVTALLANGRNALSGEIADGWYAGNVAMFGNGVYGRDTSLIAQLRIRYTDGSQQTVATDGAWRTANGPTTSADLLNGESYDARRAAALGDWTKAGYDDRAWTAVTVRPSATDKLETQTAPPVRVTQELKATRIADAGAGVFVYDLKQNMVGHARVTIAGKAGQTVRIRVAEVLNPDGTLYTANFRSAKATDYYTFAKDGTATWEPKFTFHGFRYVEITGVPAAPDASGITGVVVGSDNAQTGTLQTSSALVNQLQSNILWGQRGNFLSIPTDTPARDERMGWTGDINVFANTANYNMDSQRFLTKWLQDLRDTQNAAGAFPGVAPVVPGRFDGGYGPAGWADAGVHVPYSVWQAYGDTRVIRDSYDSMKRFVDYLQATSTDHIRNVGGYNDWLNLDDDTPATVIDTAFAAKSTREFAEMAAAIGRTDDAQAYRARYEAIKAAYGAAFVTADGTVRGDSQTAYILTIMNGLIPAGLEGKVADRFVHTLERRSFHLSTGFLGVDGLLPALSAIGRTDIAYRLLQNTDYPSWGYEIGKGATTIWERWNSIMPDGSFGPVDMNSFNHYAYGAVGEWMYRTLAGVSALEPGFHKVLIAPQPGSGIDWAKYSLKTPYGAVSSSWTSTAGAMKLDIAVPANTTAEVRIPASSRWAVTEAGVPAESAKGVTFVRFENGIAVYTVGSGTYAFATDDNLGRLGDVRAAAGELTARIDALSTGGGLTAAQASKLRALVKTFAAKADLTWNAFVNTRPGRIRDAVVAAAAHTTLGSAQAIAAYVEKEAAGGRMPLPSAAALRGILRPVDAKLSAAISALVGASATITVPTTPVFPGDKARVTLELNVTGPTMLGTVQGRLTSVDGWTVTPVSTAGDRDVRPGAKKSFVYDVTVPADAAPGAYTLDGVVTSTLMGTTVSIPRSAPLTVSAPIGVTGATLSAPSAHPGDEVSLDVVVENRTPAARSGTLTLTPPTGWAAPTVPFTAPAGGSATVSARLTVPYTVTAGPAEITASVGASAQERTTASLAVALSAAPAVSFDYVDLGVAASERAHALTASANSGTSTEAGLTRRYTHSSYPGGWFEMDVAVPAGQPFVVRARETFDGARTKTYDVLADGVRVFSQGYTRSASGEGVMEYQFVVDDPTITADGTVRLRFQDVDGAYDPSIADVWILPVRAGLDAAQNVLAGSTATARTSLQAAPSWSVGNLVDGLRTSVAGGAKGYTSDGPDRATAGVDQWVAFDMGATTSLDTVVLYPRTATADEPAADGVDGAHFPKAFDIQVSTDGTTWTTVRSVSGQADPGARPQVYSFTAVEARHVRIAVSELGRPTVEEGALGYHRLQLAEVQAFRLGA